MPLDDFDEKVFRFNAAVSESRHADAYKIFYEDNGVAQCISRPSLVTFAFESINAGFKRQSEDLQAYLATIPGREEDSGRVGFVNLLGHIRDEARKSKSGRKRKDSEEE